MKAKLPLAVMTAAGVIVVLPLFIASDYHLGVLALVTIYAVAALAQNLLTGYAKVPSLGNVSFFAVSAYTTGSLISLSHTAWPLAFAAGILAAGALGLFMGLPTLRISGMHLAIVTLLLVFGAQEVMNQWDQNHDPSGVGVDTPAWLTQGKGLYVAGLLLAVISYLLVWNVLRSRSGRALIALSENPLAATSIGVNVLVYRLSVFLLSGLLTGAAGILFLYSNQHVDPSTFSLDLSLAFLTMIVLGGMRSLGGSLLGAIIIGLLPQVLDLFPGQLGQMSIQALRPGIYALLVLLTLRFLPDGIWNGVMNIVSERAEG